MRKKNPIVPCIMYHSVGIPNKKWHWDFLTCPYQTFDNQLKWLKKTGYSTLVFQELHDYIIHDKKIPEKSVFLTFDDGYLDNFVFVYPLLKKYGMKGTIFVNPDFVDETNGYRKTFNKNLSKSEVNQLKISGFCNWDELRKMDKEGVLDVQSHAKTHDWYPISEKIIDFRHPKDDYIWMDWNEYPNEKPSLQYINKEKVKLGSAVFENEKALSSKRVFINPKFQKQMQKYVIENGDEKFYNNSLWKDKLYDLSSSLKKSMPIIIEEESDFDYLERIKFELEFTKLEIEKQLDKDVKFLCWPGGSATKEGVRIAKELGYLMSTAARDIPELRKKIKNTSDNKINRIARFAPDMYSYITKRNKKSRIKYSSGWFFILMLMQFQNNFLAGFIVKSVRYINKRMDMYIFKY